MSAQSVGSPRRPTYESLGKESVNGEELLHLRLVPETEDKVDAEGSARRQWLLSDGRNGWLLRRSRSTITLFKQTAIADITYEALPGDATIEAPVGDARSSRRRGGRTRRAGEFHHEDTKTRRGRR